MRLPADEKHPQAVAHPVDLDQRGIVAVGQLSFGLGQREPDHIAPAVGQGDGKFQILPHGDAEGLWRLPIDRNFKRGQRVFLRGGPKVVDAQGQGHGFADDGKGRGVADGQAAIPIALLSGHQQMHRCGQIDWQVGVVNASVTKRKDACDTGARLFGKHL